MEKAICKALAKKFANLNQVDVAMVIRRKCWDFFEANKLPKGWEATEIVKPDVVKPEVKNKKSESI